MAAEFAVEGFDSVFPLVKRGKGEGARELDMYR